MVRIPIAGLGTLEAIIDEPAAPSEDAVLICHPHPAFGGRMDTPLISALALAFSGAGYRALRFHYRGIEASDGEATGGLVEHEDVLAADRFLRDEGAGRVAWVGYSFGALMAWRAIDAGGRPPAYVGIAIPTTIIDGDADRIAATARAAETGVPGLFVSGDRDPLCEADKLRSWLGETRVAVETLAGEAHAFSLAGTRAVVRRSVAFVREALER